MQIDRKLNLIIGLDRLEGTSYVHAMPIARPVFERYYLVMAKAFAEIYAGGLGPVAGPRVSALVLKDIAGEGWGGANGVEMGLMNEIRRLTNILAPGPNGWGMQPWTGARAAGLVDEDEESEVENALVFFTLASVMHKKSILPATLAVMGSLWGSSTTSLPAMEFVNSLPTSTPADATGASPTASSVPS